MSYFNWTIDIIGCLVILSAIFMTLVFLPVSSRKAARQCYVAMARAVEAREPHLVGQAEQTAAYVKVMGWLSLSMRPRDIVRLETAALLHTLGKVGVSFALLNSPQSLCSAGERYAVREYVRIGAAMLEAVPDLKDCAPAVLYHREYLDGSGYPFGRHGKGIPSSAQMLCVASEFVALTSPRIYRAGLPAMSHEDALRYLRSYAGRRYDNRFISLLATSYRLVKWQQRFAKQITLPPQVNPLRQPA